MFCACSFVAHGQNYGWFRAYFCRIINSDVCSDDDDDGSFNYKKRVVADIFRSLFVNFMRLSRDP